MAVEARSATADTAWPPWPVHDETERAALTEVLDSGRWTVSGNYVGTEPFERRFSRAFASYIGVQHCVPTCHGSSALVVALEALGIGAGDEVLVPGLTWVACASAVLTVGAVPILVDIDLASLSMSLQAAEAAMTERTAAIMLVHLFCSAGDLDGFVSLARRRGLALIEDVSQAHGARWDGRRLGSFGDVAAFSFQQTKLLTAGEGGAALTDDPALADRMQQLRADGRRYVAAPRRGELDLEEVGAVQGRNYCMSEFHAALLTCGLARLDAQNAVRSDNVAVLRGLLDERQLGLSIIEQPAALEPTYYHLCLRLDADAFGGATAQDVADAAAAELGLFVEAVDRPLNDNPLYAPLLSTRVPVEERAAFDPGRFELPAATEARRRCLTVPHRALLGGPADLQRLLDGFSAARDRLAEASARHQR